jgi:hypothetical protein
VGNGAVAKPAMQVRPAAGGPTSEPGTQRAQYYSEAASAAILDQLEPVSHQSVALGRGELRVAADSADSSVKPQVRGDLSATV